MDKLALRTLEYLRRALPPNDHRAVCAWIETFYPYQQNWILDPVRFALLVKSRQIGASHSYAAWALLRALVGQLTTVISVGQREADEIIEKAGRHAAALERLGSTWAKGKPTTDELKLATGGRILSLPATSGGRSYSGNVILDEAAYYQHPEKVWDGAGGVVMHGFAMRVLSTPNGVGNLFHELVTDEKAHEGYRMHAVTLDQARAEGLRVDEAECWKMARGDPRVFDQLFRCKFLDGDAQYIPSDLISAALYEGPSQGEVYGGLDIGRTADLTALVLVYMDKARVRWEFLTECRKRTSQTDLDELVELAAAKGCRRLCVDATGMGAFPAEQMKRFERRMQVEPVVFSLSVKEDLATSLYQAIAQLTGRIRKANAALRDDLCAIRRIVTSAGNVRYDAPHTDKGHADRAWAYALALHASSRGGRAGRIGGTVSTTFDTIG